jgi:hypothetical protein
VGDGIDVLETQVFQFAANLAHAQPVRDGSIDVEGLSRDFLLAIRVEMLERAHVVQPVRKFDQDDANVVDHGQHHLAEVLRLRLFA